MGDKHIVAPTGNGFHRQVGRAVQQGGNLGINAVDHVDLTRLQRRGPCSGIVQHQHFVIIGVAAVVGVPVVFVALEAVAHAGLVNFQCVRAGADARAGVVHAAIGLNHQVVVGQQIGKVSVADAQFNDEVVAIDLHVLDTAHDAQCTGLAVLIRMALHGFQHVFGCHFLAVVELDALADFERPGFRIGRGLVAFGHAVFDFPVGIDLDKAFVQVAQVVQRHFGGGQRRIKRVGGFTARRPDFQCATANRCFVGCGLRVVRQHRVGDGGCHAQCSGTPDEFAACHSALGHLAGHMFQLIIHDENSLF